MNDETTRSLAGRAREGDRAAFDALATRHERRLKSLLRSRIGERLRNRVDVDDLVQETFLRAFRSMAHFTWQGEGSFFRWLSRIGEHLIWNAAQRQPRSDLSLDRELEGSVTPPATRARREERLARLERCLAKLTPEQRQAVLLSRVDGLKIKEIATRMDRSPGAVKMLVLRALRDLKSTFGDTESMHLPDRPIAPEEIGDDSSDVS